MAIMLEGGCKKCGRLCSTGIDAYMVEKDNKVVEVPATYQWTAASTVEILCYECYDEHYSKEAKRNKKLEQLLKPKPWWKKLFN